MQQNTTPKKLNCCQFPQQETLCNKQPFSHNLLHTLLDLVYTENPPFTGFLRFSGEDSFLFLFFFNGAPYAAGRFADSKPASYSIQDLGRELAKTADKSVSVTLCETDPVLLKDMLLFLQEEPAIKAPPTLIDFDYVIRQIGEAGANAMIALCRDNYVNFYFFKDGKGARAHYADLSFKRPEGMTIDEEMLLYAFQPEGKVLAYVFRDMITAESDDSSKLDKDSLFRLLTVGYLQDRRRESREASPPPENRTKADAEIPTKFATDIIETLATAIKPSPKPPGVLLSVESGPLKGERFTVALPCTIGRKECDLILDDRQVSRRHAELKLVDGTLVIEDLASKNGTRVNGTAVTSSPLVINDLISIGPTILRISRS